MEKRDLHFEMMHFFRFYSNRKKLLSFYFSDIYLKNSIKEKFNELQKKTINNLIIYSEI